MTEGAGGLIGRRAELALLEGLLDQARRGTGMPVVVAGEAGIGKTALVDALAARAGDGGARVAWGRCTAAESPPYWPWVQALRSLGSDMPQVRAHGHRADLFAGVVDRLERATAATPGVVILEDLHWADESSLALLHFVIDAVPGISLLLVATLRDEPGETARGLHLADLRPGVHRIALGGLDLEGSSALIERATGRRPDAADAEAVQRRTAGNPFFVLEVARLGAARGRVTAFDVPPAVRQVLSRRLARLSQPTVAVLEAASVLGEPSIADLTPVTGRTEDEVAECLVEATAARLLVRDGLGFQFAHALVRDTMYANLAPSVRARLHRDAASMLEARHGAAPVAQLAFHRLHAGDEENRRRGAAHALEAARLATGVRAYEQAVRYYGWALDSGVDDAVAARVGLGEARVLSGDLVRGRDELRAAAKDAAARGRGEEMARALLAMGTGVGGFEVDTYDDEQAALLTEALEVLPATDSPMRAAVLARRSLAVALTADPADRAAAARGAVEMAERVGDAAAQVAALAALCDALAGPDHVRDRLEAADRMLALAQRARTDVLVPLARRLRLVALLELGDLAAVDREIGLYARVADRLRIPLFSWLVPIWRGMRAAMHGDVERALAAADEAEAIGRRAGSTNAVLMVFTLRMATLRQSGAAGEFIDLHAQDLADAEAMPGFDCVAAVLHAQAGDLERGRRHLRRMMAAGIDSLPRDSEWIEVLWHLGEAAMLLDERDAARAVRDALRPYGALWAVDGIGGACFGQVADLLARLDRQLAAAPQPVGVPDEGVLARSGTVWRLRFRGEEAVVPDSKGMRDIATLLSRPGEDVHVLDLVGGLDDGGAGSPEGDAGALLDARARAEYRARLVELSGELAEARSQANLELADRLAGEREAIERELSRAFGLGGRARAAGDRAERARKAVTMRIATAQRAVDAALPSLGRHLHASVRTGRLCVYAPEHRVAWKVSADIVTRGLTPSR